MPFLDYSGSQIQLVLELPEGFIAIQIQILISPPHFLTQWGRGGGCPRTCLSNKFPGDAGGLTNDHTLRTIELEEFYLQQVKIPASGEFPNEALNP